jgi:DNA-binding PadR family transcriptional regulator
LSIKQGLLALLTERPRYGYQLRQDFERRTGGTWPLNIGQVYATLNRLERDGLVAELEHHLDGAVVYGATEAGMAEVAAWWSTPVARDVPSREELTIKIALAVTLPGVDVAAVVQRQRVESLRSLQRFTRLKVDGADEADLAWMLVIENLIFATEAEIRWLDHVERALRPAGAPRARRAAGSASTPASGERDEQPGPAAAAGPTPEGVR